ncbi:radical SAM protein [Candidatus Woesearchaeota archaeon]|nr:hypothetical protein [uncultured archaeon]AQS34317.1 hypothetical protein [uncultured archaeon]AQS34331.1 hypothetical protein [uncultured archaeon]MBS3121736.1 radical SAM protein [Candidatus Woesearchaeota archaeon]
MHKIILDCYTDEPAGLGVPPYLGTYPRYLYGYLKKKFGQEMPIYYLTIDDLRLFVHYHNKKPETKENEKSNIKIFNLTKNSPDTRTILENTDEMYIVLGVHVPGKYLTAEPGTLRELSTLFNDLNKKASMTAKTILTGPAATEFGTRSEGGKFAERQDAIIFDEVKPEIGEDYNEIATSAVIGAKIVKQLGWNYIIAEIETSRGCRKAAACSFCTEPLKHRFEFRKINDIVDEVKALNKQGITYFRLGKQSDFFSWSQKDIEEMLSRIRGECETKECETKERETKKCKTKECKIDVLHIDNVDPVNVTEEKVKLVVKYCTSGNVAALGAETFDEDVVKANNLNSAPATTMRAIDLINKFGSERGENGMQRFLPGINLLFGLKDESKRTHAANMQYLKEILVKNLLLRRINIRQVAIFPGTQLYKECGNKFLRKNKKYYWKWRNEIRQEIDNAMLKRLLPVGTVLKDCIAEIYDGKTTFLRQIGTYPLIVGVKGRIELGKFYNLKVTGYMLRSVIGEVV